MSDTSRFTDTVYLSGINVFFIKSGQKQGVILLITNSWTHYASDLRPLNIAQTSQLLELSMKH